MVLLHACSNAYGSGKRKRFLEGMPEMRIAFIDIGPECTLATLQLASAANALRT